jgi:hypothetical protein
MADQSTKRDTATAPPEGRKTWSAPRLLEYGHIGKLTQGSSGTKNDSGTKRMTCL